MANVGWAPGEAGRVVWSAAADRSVVTCTAEPVASNHRDACCIDRLSVSTTIIVATSGCEHLALSDGFRRIRLDVVSGTLLDGPVKLHYRIAGFADSEPQLLTVQRLFALHRLGRFARSLHSRETKVARWVKMIQAHDLSIQGASQRDIAGELFGPDALSEWRTKSDFLRLRIQRLLRDAEGMISGGYRDLLREPHGMRSDASR